MKTYKVKSPLVSWEGNNYRAGDPVELDAQNLEIWEKSGLQLEPFEEPEEETEVSYHDALKALAEAGIKPESKKKEDVLKAYEELGAEKLSEGER